MTDKQKALLARLHNHEDNFLERKVESETLSEFRRAIVGFANSVPEERTAVLFIGVDNNGKILGVGNTDTLQKKIEKTCRNDCYPPIVQGYATEVLEENGNKILAVEVHRSKNRPHFAGGAFVRVGSETLNASPAVFEEMILARTSAVAEILKWKGQSITMEDTFRDGSGGVYLRPQRCTVVDCNSHFVSLQTGTYTNLTISLQNIKLSTDPFAHNRLKMTVLVQEHRLDSLVRRLFESGGSLREEMIKNQVGWGSVNQKHKFEAWLEQLERLSVVPEFKNDLVFLSRIKSLRSGLLSPQSGYRGYDSAMVDLLACLEQQLKYYVGIAL